ncbi:hypothetical protein HDU90_003837 [Geranomyces variabilis]|nr:hypothetical protein HDU90_003837 [Geranomyces variabilis]
MPIPRIVVLGALLPLLLLEALASPSSGQLFPQVSMESSLGLENPRFARFTVEPDVFAQTSPDTDDQSFPLAPPRLGLLDDAPGRWARLSERVQKLQQEAGDRGVVKVLVFQRHGQGEHNAAEIKYGKKAWDDYWSKQPQFFDAQLTPLGITQLSAQASVVAAERAAGMTTALPFSSPLSRCLDTTTRVFGKQEGVVLENLREVYGEHTCDHRRRASELKARWSGFDFSDLSEEDKLWTPNERETVEHSVIRVRGALSQIMAAKEGQEVLQPVVCHGGVIEALIQITGHRVFDVPPGGALPMVLTAWFE